MKTLDKFLFWATQIALVGFATLIAYGVFLAL